MTSTIERDFINNQSLHNIATELVTLRKDKKQLESRIRNIELTNTELQQKLTQIVRSNNLESVSKINDSMQSSNLDNLTSSSRYLISPSNRTRRFLSVSPAAKAQNIQNSQRIPQMNSNAVPLQTNDSNIVPIFKQSQRKVSTTINEELLESSIDIRESFKRKEIRGIDEPNHPLLASFNDTPMRSRIKPTRAITLNTESDLTDRFNPLGANQFASPQNFNLARKSFDKKII